MPPFTKTVRFKLTVWYSSLLLVFGVAFVVALNLAVRLDHPDFVVVRGMSNVTYEPVREGPGGAINGFQQVLTPAVILKQAEDEIYSRNIDRLRTWSLLAVVGLALASGLGGYTLSGMMLRPVRDMTEAASEISATNLSRRINHQGPDDEMKALADTFDSMIARLQTSFERQRQFVQDASHELRTPLAAIRTNIEVTEMDPDVSQEEYRELLELVKGQTERLARLSEDLLLLSNEDRAGPVTEPVSLTAVATEVGRQLNPLASSRGVEISVDEERSQIWALGNGDLIYRCVSNLVDNAIKYSGTGAKVRIRAFNDTGLGAVSVSDTGPGIPAEDVPKVFDRFYRVDKGRSRRQGGSGLGLAIVKELIESMGGSVSVESTPGLGANFIVRLPLAARADIDARPSVLV